MTAVYTAAELVRETLAAPTTPACYAVGIVEGHETYCYRPAGHIRDVHISTGTSCADILAVWPVTDADDPVPDGVVDRLVGTVTAAGTRPLATVRHPDIQVRRVNVVALVVLCTVLALTGATMLSLWWWA